MRYKNLEIVPFWTTAEKKQAIETLISQEEEIDRLKEELQIEKQYSQNAIKCNERLQLQNCKLVRENEKSQKDLNDLIFIKSHEIKSFWKKFLH
jgi:FtsZ-binding cell division protein ZapB